jgi:hypothetical protein
MVTSPNTDYTAHCVRPNPDFVWTSYSPKSLYAISAVLKIEELKI